MKVEFIAGLLHWTEQTLDRVPNQQANKCVYFTALRKIFPKKS